MPQTELTDKFCRAAKVKAGAIRTDFYDTTVRGLCLRVGATGKVWYLRLMRPGRRSAWLKLGTYPTLALGGPTGARQRAKDERAKVDEGSDPVALEKAQTSTVSDLIENYVARAMDGKRSRDEVRRRLKKNVGDVIGNVRLGALHRRDLVKALDRVKDRGAPVEANRTFEDLRAMIRWARGRGDLDSNIAEFMPRPAEVKPPRDRVLTADEIATAWAAIADGDMRETTKRIVQLCLVTAQRVGEVAGMARAEIDLDRATWTIPGARAKNKRDHLVPLSDLAVRIIRDQLAEVNDLCARKGREPPPFVFPARGGAACVDPIAVAKSVKRGEARTDDDVATIMGVAPWTPHDLRRTAATGMEELGVSPFIVGHCLNHVSATKATITSRVYARYDYAKEKREALDLWASRLEGIIGGKAGKVVSLRGASEGSRSG